ncbi:MAG: hypothetical protein NVS3B5_10540 [Sphingomicrobium sp.]
MIRQRGQAQIGIWLHIQRACPPHSSKGIALLSLPDQLALSSSDDWCLRRYARKRGFALVRFRGPVDRSVNHGGYRLVDAATRSTVAGTFFELTASDVLEWIEILSAAAEP